MRASGETERPFMPPNMRGARGWDLNMPPANTCTHRIPPRPRAHTHIQGRDGTKERRRACTQRARTAQRAARTHAHPQRPTRANSKPGWEDRKEPRRSTAPARNIRGAQPRRSTAPARNIRALPHRAGRVVVVVEEVGCGDVRRVSGEVQACTPFRVWDQPEILLGAWLCRPRPHPPLPLFDRGTLLCTRAKRRHALAQLCPVVRCCFVAARSLFCRDVQMCPVPPGGRRNPPALRAGSRFKHASAYAWR